MARIFTLLCIGAIIYFDAPHTKALQPIMNISSMGHELLPKLTTAKCDVDATAKVFNRCARLIDHYIVALRMYTLPQANESESDLEKRFRNVINYFCGFVNSINTCTTIVRQLCPVSGIDEFVRDFDEQSMNIRQASDSYCLAHNQAKVNFGCLAGIQPTIDAQCKKKLKRTPRDRRNVNNQQKQQQNEVDPECATSIEYFLECNRYVAKTLCGKASGDARASMVMLSVLQIIHPGENPCASDVESDLIGDAGDNIHDSAEDEAEGDINEAEQDMELMELGEESFYMPKQHDTIYITRMVPVFGKDDLIAKDFVQYPQLASQQSNSTLTTASDDRKMEGSQMIGDKDFGRDSEEVDEVTKTNEENGQTTVLMLTTAHPKINTKNTTNLTTATKAPKQSIVTTTKAAAKTTTTENIIHPNNVKVLGIEDEDEEGGEDYDYEDGEGEDDEDEPAWQQHHANMTIHDKTTIPIKGTTVPPIVFITMEEVQTVIVNIAGDKKSTTKPNQLYELTNEETNEINFNTTKKTFFVTDGRQVTDTCSTITFTKSLLILLTTVASLI